MTCTVQESSPRSVMCLGELAVYAIQTKVASRKRTVRDAYPKDFWDASLFF